MYIPNLRGGKPNYFQTFSSKIKTKKKKTENNSFRLAYFICLQTAGDGMTSL